MEEPPAECILRVAVPAPLPGLFDYLPAADGAPPGRGVRVLVGFGRRELVGVIVARARESQVPPDQLHRVLRTLDDGRPTLDDELLSLLEWCWRYYKHPPGEVLFNALPPALRRADGQWPARPVEYRLTEAGHSRLAEGPGRAPAQWGLLECIARGPATAVQLRSHHAGWKALVEKLMGCGWVEEQAGATPALAATPGPALTAEQAAALKNIRADLGGFRCHLLDGITGSGKTEIYLQLIEEVIAAGRQALVLVPEIGLTPQLVERMARRLGIAPAVSHSGLAAGERLKVWAAAARAESPLLLGTRSALFLPLPNPGLIIMDESHDASFKQQDGFRFAARDVAIMRASNLGVPIVLGTATPALETVRNASIGRYTWNRLRERATGAEQPSWRVTDLRQQSTEAGLAASVLEAMAETLGRGEQVLVFLNRRGYAPVLLCHECGWHAACHRCDANMTWHREVRSLVCHHCGHRSALPRLCPDCAADALQGAGAGTEQLESFLAKRFEGTPLYRFDRDVTRRKGSMDRMIGAVKGGEPAILVGTQMLAKGHHFPRVTLVVIVNLDQALYSADFRSTERMGQLMTQVAGRAGRAEHPGQVILQTHHPDHPLLELLFRQGYERFALALLEERQLAGLPPFAAQATLRAEAHDRTRVQGFLEQARDLFGRGTSSVHGPFPALMERRGGRVRWYLLVQDPNRAGLQKSLDPWLADVRALPGARRVRWAVDVDPQDF
jgi:primosomal protein N' (replication factor Y)